jgi:hypothetical protein
VTLSDSLITCFQGNPKVYSIGEDPLSFGVQYLNQTSVLNIKLTSFQKPIALNKEQEIELPFFVKFDTKSKIFTLDGASFTEIGIYNIGLKLGYTEYPDSQVMCTTQITIKYVPKFIGNTIDTQTLACKFPWSFKVPTYTDTFKQSVTTNVNLGETRAFLEYDEVSRIIKTLDPELLEKFIGSFEIKI